MATASEILQKTLNDNKFIDDTINATLAAAMDRINGDSNNDEYKKRIDEIKKSVEAKKEQERKIALIKSSQEVVTNGSSNIGQGVPSTVQTKI